ncbi:hypothetical protein OPV22_007385 [Ensete ventricosum]|uniref:Uncharacterized protein n=1 Tax=Ensete ventricosum TaxID=4639 RepID=A0AAV8RQ56_ENSVE|nr:hypothetical protein OPV22_007385 [Ensete ventricosum]
MHECSAESFRRLLIPVWPSFIILWCCSVFLELYSVSSPVVSSSRSSDDPKDTECELFHRFEPRQGEVKWPPPPLLGLQLECELMLSKATRGIDRTTGGEVGSFWASAVVPRGRNIPTFNTGGRRDRRTQGSRPSSSAENAKPNVDSPLCPPPLVAWKRQMTVIANGRMLSVGRSSQKAHVPLSEKARL